MTMVQCLCPTYPMTLSDDEPPMHPRLGFGPVRECRCYRCNTRLFLQDGVPTREVVDDATEQQHQRTTHASIQTPRG